MDTTTINILLTPAAGKRLIAKAVSNHLLTQDRFKAGTVVIIAGTTNGYIAEEILQMTGQPEGFSRKRFFRGITLPPGIPQTESGRLSDESQFPGDVVISKGVWKKSRTIFDVVDLLEEGDIIIKGANCIDLVGRKAGVLIGHPKGGTVAAALQAVTGRRVRLILTAGLEKRVYGSIDQTAALVNAPGATGPRLYPVSGEIVSELEAIRMLTGAQARLVAGGGVCGAEGSVWIAVSGSEEQMKEVKKTLGEIKYEPAFCYE